MSGQAKLRFLDPGVILYEMLDEVLVVCPACRGCARIIRQDASTPGWFAPRRLVCGGCSCVRDWADKALCFATRAGVPVDPYFSLPLWLQANFRGRILWAFNPQHLRLLEAHVGASLREHRRREGLGWQNQSLVNRLPKWMTAGKNREDVLRVIARLQRSLGS